MAAATALVVFGSVVLFALWYMRNRNQMEDRVRALSNQRRTLLEQEDPFSHRVLFPVVHGLTSHIVRFMPTSVVSRSRKWLIIADSTMNVSTFMGIVLITTTLPAAAYFILIWSQTNGSPSRLEWVFIPVIILFGFIVPQMLLRRRAKNRQLKFWKALPDSLDLLTTCVEAGLSLDFAFQRVADRQKGPVGDEISRMLKEKALGQTRKEALTDMAERIDLPDFYVFVNSVIQAETLGTSIGQVLRTQSRQLRMRRRQRAEQTARQAAPKMVFPLVFCIMPTLFIVILGPIIIKALDVFSST